MKKLVLFFLPLVFVVSCDPVVSYDKVIQNNSSFDIWLKPNDSMARLENIKDSVLLFKGERIGIATGLNIGDGDPNDYSDCPLYPFPSDTLLTRIDGDASLRLNFSIDENADWEFEVLEPGRSGKAECILILTDMDID